MHANLKSNMKRLLSIFLLCTLVLTLSAAPARQGWQSRTLADGTTMELQLSGDEYYHFLRTRDGRLVRQTEAGLVLSDEPFPTPAQIAQRRAAQKAMRAPQATGIPAPVPRVLVILVSYADVKMQTKNSVQAMDSLFNAPGYAYNGATGSARDYFIAQSDSAYTPVFDVVGPVTLANNRKYYGENSSGNTDKRAREMVKEACQAVDATVDFSLYDSNNDGIVDAVYVIYAGIGANDIGGDEEAVWPHQSTVSGLTLDGKQIRTYACSGEIDGVAKDRTGIGPICHEFGHAIGMPDYYSTGPSSAYIVCEWSVMDYGMYNNGANTPPNYSIFDKQYMGWATVDELEAGAQADITLTTAYGNGYKMNAGETAYYIENRQKKGWDAYLPGHGMLLWQVKYSQADWTSNRVNYTNTSPRYSLISAAYGLMTNGDQHFSSAEDPFPGSTDIRSYTPSEGYALTDITEKNGIVTFKLNGGAPDDPTAVEQLLLKDTHAKGRKLLENGQLLILRGDKRYNALGIEIR